MDAKMVSLVLATTFASLLIGSIGGYMYGFRAYNRSVKPWEFWLK